MSKPILPPRPAAQDPLVDEPDPREDRISAAARREQRPSARFEVPLLFRPFDVCAFAPTDIVIIGDADTSVQAAAG